MALTPFAFKLLLPHLNGSRVLAFGYPDLLMTRKAVTAWTRGELSKTAPWDGAAHKFKGEAAETVEALESAGMAHFECIDVNPSRGQETCRDLNDPLPPEYREAYDLVIDAGTIEHCANVGQALMSAAQAVKPGGRVFHSPPLSMVNHGFYNVNPTLLHDFYTQNGWGVEHLSGFGASTFQGFEVDPTSRATLFPAGAALYFLACRPEGEAQVLKWPTQSRYKR
jgi:SAM-dependent methyltransferase